MEENPDSEEQYAKKMQEAQRAREAEIKIRSLMRQILEQSAYERLVNIRFSNESLYYQLVQMFAMLHQQGKLKKKITEDELKLFVSRLLSGKREGKISFARK